MFGLSTELIARYIGHGKEIQMLMLRALALCRSESSKPAGQLLKGEGEGGQVMSTECVRDTAPLPVPLPPPLSVEGGRERTLGTRLQGRCRSHDRAYNIRSLGVEALWQVWER